MVRVACACVTDGARVLLVRRGRGLLAGTWSLPEAPLGSAAASDAAGDVARRAAAEVGVGAAAAVAHRGAVRHVFTHRDVTAEVFRIEVIRAGRARDGQRWVAAAGMKELGVSSFTRKTVALGLATKRDNLARRS